MRTKVNWSDVPRSLKAAGDTAEEIEPGSGQYLLTPEQYERLEEAIWQARADQIIIPLPNVKPESADAYSESQLETIREWLKLLGFLDQSAQEDWGALETAVRRFQRAAFGEDNLTIDGWVGEETWGALQELVSFEEPSNLEKWLDSNKKPCPALQRALHLRLFALGMAETQPGQNIKPTSIDAGLRNFAAVWRTLKWEGLKLQTTLTDIDLATLEVIFDQDALVARLATSRSPNEVEEKLLIRPFVIAMAKIELWLAGFDGIRPDGYNFEERALADRGIDLNNDHPLYAVLVQYFDEVENDDHSASKIKAKNFVSLTFPAFFAGIQSLLTGADDDLSDSGTVFDDLDPNLLQQAWDGVYKIRARIWDGIKRAWHWFKGIINKAIGNIDLFLKNLSRIAHQYVLKAYEGVEAVIKCVCRSITFFTRPILKLPLKQYGISEPGGLVIGRDRDFDFRSLVDAYACAEEINIMADYVAGKAKLFNMSCRFLASMLNILLSLLKKTSCAGWVGLLMALLKLYKSIAYWVPIFIEAQQQEEASTVA